MKRITMAQARKVLWWIDGGLVQGGGVEGRRGWVCVEQAVSMAIEGVNEAYPKCVHHSIAGMKQYLNDASGWPSNKARAIGLRDVAIAQLGSAYRLDGAVFGAYLREHVGHSFTDMLDGTHEKLKEACAILLGALEAGKSPGVNLLRRIKREDKANRDTHTDSKQPRRRKKTAT